MAISKITKNTVRNAQYVPGYANADKVNEIIDAIQEGEVDFTVADLAVTGDLTVTGATTLNGTLTLGDAAADALTINATTTYAEPVNYSNATAITAFATGGQASATALTEEVNNVTVCATAGDSVKLPAAVAGRHVYVKNSGAAALDIFPASADSIDALAINLAVRIQPGSSIHFYAKDAIVWESDKDQSLTLVAPTTNTGQLELKATSSAGNTVTTITNASQAAARTYTVPDAGADASFLMSAGVNSYSSTTGITADINADQTNATQLTTEFNEITTCGTNGDAVKLPTAVAGKKVTVKNNGAANAAVFPATGDSINLLAANTAIVLPSGATKTFYAVDATVWEEEADRIATNDGTVSLPAYTFNDQTDMGMYKISSTQLGFATAGGLKGGFNSAGMFADVIAEQTSTVGVTIDGALIKDGSFIGKQATATATAAGLTTGALTGADQFVTVTSASANDVIALPLDANVPVGTVIRGWVGANGFELRSNASDTTLTINNVTAGTTNEAAIPATTLFKVEKVAALTWILTALDEAGAVIAAIVPDSI